MAQKTNDQKRLTLSIGCAAIATVVVIGIPLLRLAPFMESKEIAIDNGDSHVIETRFYYDDFELRIDDKTAIGKYGDVRESNVRWAWAMLEFWFFLLALLTAAAVGLNVFRWYQLADTARHLDPRIQLWSNRTTGLAIFALLCQWFLFIIVMTQENWETIYRPSLFTAIPVDLTPSLGFFLLFLHIVGLVALLLSNSPESIYPSEKIFCPNCGCENPSIAKFCRYCATLLHS